MYTQGNILYIQCEIPPRHHKSNDMKRRVIEFVEQGIFQRNITKMIGYNQSVINYLF